MQVRFIGCADAFGSRGRFNTCFHVTDARSNFLIDCGATSLVALKQSGVDLEAIDAILVTHFHGDHFAGLPFLLLDAQFSRRSRPLAIAGPEGIAARLAQVMEALFENSSSTAQKFDLSILTLAPGRRYDIGHMAVEAFPVVHGASGGPFHAYRIAAEGRIIAYSGDTEWTETLIPAAQGADLFIAEAYTFDKAVKNHLSLGDLERNLARINPKKLVLTHLGRDMLERRETLPYLAAHDGLVVDV